MTDLPEHWAAITLGDVIDGFEAGRSLQAQGRPASGSEYGVLKISAVSWGSFDPAQNKALFATDKPLPHEAVRAGDLLISRANTTELVGAPVLVDNDHPNLMLPDKILRVRYRCELVDPRYLLHSLRAAPARRHMEAEATGTSDSMRNLSQPKLRLIPLRLAPRQEQQRIADRLDVLLTRVDACRTHLDRIPIIVKRFRQAVTEAATNGTLTESWRAEMQRVTSWSTGTLADLLDGKPRNGYSPPAVDWITPVRSFTLTATTSGRFLLDHYKYVDEVVPADSHLWLQPGDILIQRANTLEYVGTSALYEGPPSGFIYPDLMMKARAGRAVSPQFLLLLLKSLSVRAHFRVNATGTAGNMPKINQQVVLSAPARWPDRDEQVEIVRRAESLFTLADAIEARFIAARAKVERLTPALLAKTFRGELVPQNPQDEPVSALLTRLRGPNKPDATQARKSGRRAK